MSTKYTLALIDQFDANRNVEYMFADTSHELSHCLRYMNNNTFTTSANEVVSASWADAVCTHVLSRLSGEHAEINGRLAKLTNTLMERDSSQEGDPDLGEGVLVLAKMGVNEYGKIVAFTFVAGPSECVEKFVTAHTEV